MDTINPLLKAISQNLDALLARLQRGEDCPPADQLRLEGLMQAAVLLDFVEAAELHALFEQRYHTITGHRVQDRHGEDWQTFFVFPSLPLFAKAAPVHPTTKN